jgi:8-oxo-dGTP diphosphatase
MAAERSIRVGAAGIIIENGKILLVKFDDENGRHYNYPGGGH